MFQAEIASGFSAIEKQRRARSLPVRLKREGPWGASIGLALILGLIFLFLGGGIGLIATMGPSEVRRSWLMLLLGGMLAGLGLLLVYSGIYQWLATRVRESIVEIDSERLAAGQTARICVRQEGPVTLNSLKAHLICLERTHHWKTRNTLNDGTEEYCTTDEIQLHNQSIFDEQPSRISIEEFWEKSGEFLIPSNCRPSQTTRELDVIWKIEVVGQVQARPDFKHSFVIPVVT